MSALEDAAYLFRRSREEGRKAETAVQRGASGAVIAAHRELALRYRVRALAASSGTVPCLDAVGAASRFPASF